MRFTFSYAWVFVFSISRVGVVFCFHFSFHLLKSLFGFYFRIRRDFEPRPATRTAICLLVLRGLRGDSRGAAAPCIHADDELLGGALRRHKVKVRHPKK